MIFFETVIISVFKKQVIHESISKWFSTQCQRVNRYPINKEQLSLSIGILNLTPFQALLEVQQIIYKQVQHKRLFS